MVTLKKLLLLMSIMPSVMILAMDSSSTSATKSSKSKTDSNNNNEEATRLSAIAGAPIKKQIFPQTFNENFGDQEWSDLNQSVSDLLLGQQKEVDLSGSTMQEIVRTKPSVKLFRTSKLNGNTLDSEKGYIVIPRDDNPKVEKRNNSKTIGIVYKEDVEHGIAPTIFLNIYDEDDVNGIPRSTDSLRVKNGLSVVATAMNTVASYASYADNKSQLRIFTNGNWGEPSVCMHNHEHFNPKYKEEKEEFPVSSITFLHERIIATKTPKCINLMQLLPNGMALHIACVEAIDVGTGYWTNGRKYAYAFSQELNKKERGAIDQAILRTYDNYVDHCDCLSFDYALNHFTVPQVAFIWFIKNINRLDKNDKNLTNSLSPFLIKAYKSEILQTFSDSVQSSFKTSMETTAKECGISLK